jgi:hypothetical protein
VTILGSTISISISSDFIKVGIRLLSGLSGDLILLVCTVNARSIASRLFPLLSGMKKPQTTTVIRVKLPKK